MKRPKHYLVYILLLVTAFMLPSCGKELAKINYGHDVCSECQMQIMDPKYGAELITKKGKAFKFDSIECLADFYLKKEIPHDEVESLWVIDFAKPKTLIKAESAIYIRNDKFHSPMGINVLAVKDKNESDKITGSYGGSVLSWENLLKVVETNKLLKM